ncbi:hypothetical protein NO932_09930 [Pelagibacterium sp. 26DY04]|nr:MULTISPECIES: hypothetical protein [unclassified Pelagibacterium]WMT85267.1 hypothetical protein NO932_09930 [Pelagibacterium sp. 26DY04]WMT90426.1 hypothetical protein NO934_16815 [Pelagibacterium sp. H642]
MTYDRGNVLILAAVENQQGHEGMPEVPHTGSGLQTILAIDMIRWC